MARSGKGVTITGPGFTGQVRSIGHSGEEAATYDVTELNDTHRKYISGVIESGEFECEINFDPDSAPSVGSEGTLTITFPALSGQTSGATVSCNAILQSLEWNVSRDDAVIGTVRFKVNGAITYTAGA